MAASTMTRPVGVGRTSRGPIGVEGLTMTTGLSTAAENSTGKPGGGSDWSYTVQSPGKAGDAPRIHLTGALALIVLMAVA